MPPAVPLHFDLDDESLFLIRKTDRSPDEKQSSTSSPTCYSYLFGTYSSLDETSATSQTSLSTLDPTTQQQDLLEQDPRVLVRIWDVYYDALCKRPLFVKSLTALILMVLADLSAQGVEHCRGVNIDPVNWLRAMRFGVFGLVGAPWTHYYYYYLDKCLPPTPNPWTWTTFIKVVIDQFLQAPAMLALIISGLAFMEDRKSVV